VASGDLDAQLLAGVSRGGSDAPIAGILLPMGQQVARDIRGARGQARFNFGGGKHG
jgi:hypothetical protein